MYSTYPFFNFVVVLLTYTMFKEILMQTTSINYFIILFLFQMVINLLFVSFANTVRIHMHPGAGFIVTNSSNVLYSDKGKCFNAPIAAIRAREKTIYNLI